jgi:hypothetical protein
VAYDEKRPAQHHGDADEHGNCHTVTFLCVGSAADLEELVGESSVVGRQNVLAGKVAVKGMGSGPKKRKSRGRKLGRLGKGCGPMTCVPKDKTTAVDTMGHVQENDVEGQGRCVQQPAVVSKAGAEFSVQEVTDQGTTLLGGERGRG